MVLAVIHAAGVDETSIAGLVMPTWILYLFAASAIIGAAHQIYTKGIKPMLRTMRQIRMTYEKVMEYDDRLRSVEQHTIELKTNSGSSLRDAVDRIEAGQADDRKALNDHLEWAQGEVAQVWKQIATRDIIGAADEAGKRIERGEDQDK